MIGMMLKNGYLAECMTRDPDCSFIAMCCGVPAEEIKYNSDERRFYLRDGSPLPYIFLNNIIYKEIR